MILIFLICLIQTAFGQYSDLNTGDMTVIAGAQWEFYQGDCGGNDISAHGVSGLGSTYEDRLLACATLCLERSNCVAFNYPSPGNGNCWMKYNPGRQESQYLGETCSNESPSSSWEYYTLIYAVAPTKDPSKAPTTEAPTADPTSDPTNDPTSDPTADPTNDPTSVPTIDPTIDPTADPTSDPTRDPTADPTVDPTNDPTIDPTVDPTADPTIDPTADPTIDPTRDPTADPTADPTKDPTSDPTKDPTIDPTSDPTNDPTADPTIDPTVDPTSDPTIDPTVDPTADPTNDPTTDPTNPPSQTGLNEAFGTTGGGGAGLLSAIIIVVLIIIFCIVLVVVVYMRMTKNMNAITRELTAIVDEKEAGGAAGNGATVNVNVSEGNNATEMPIGRTKMGHVQSDESKIEDEIFGDLSNM